ncbi:MAG: manganese efflux pump [Solirubrobacterales bacterium]|nr:manganese efflux pump [Solirubrobacterales bacterium]
MLALLLAAGSLGLNNFAVSIAIGLSGVDRSARVRIALAFGLFEAAMPVIGLLIGREVSHSLGSAAHIIGGLLLIAVGAQMTVSAARSRDEAPTAIADAGMGRLLLLAAALSIDNLVVGFALGAYRVPVVLGVAIIAVVSVGMSLVGLELGARLGANVEHGSALISGIAMIGIGVAILTKLL